MATIALGSELPAITDRAGLTIDGGKADITISGDDAVRVFSVAQGAELALRDLAVADGSGGGILNEGTLTVTNSTIIGNTAATRGGGIANWRELRVVDSTIGANSATGRSTQRESPARQRKEKETAPGSARGERE